VKRLCVYVVLLLSFGAESCRTSREAARSEMQPVYRAAKIMDEGLNAGADMKAFSQARGNFAAELGIVRDRIAADPAKSKILGPYYTAYEGVRQAYSFLAIVLEYGVSLETCEGPRKQMFPYESGERLSMEEKIRSLQAFSDGLKRIGECVKEYGNLDASIRRQADELHICPEGPSYTCVLQNAHAKLKEAENLITQN
jgi:hypothetical protein